MCKTQRTKRHRHKTHISVCVHGSIDETAREWHHDEVHVQVGIDLQPIVLEEQSMAAGGLVKECNCVSSASCVCVCVCVCVRVHACKTYLCNLIITLFFANQDDFGARIESDPGLYGAPLQAVVNALKALRGDEDGPCKVIIIHVGHGGPLLQDALVNGVERVPATFAGSSTP